LADYRKPIVTNFASEPTPFERLVLFIGHFDTRVYLTEHAYIDVGAGSLPTIANIAHVSADDAGCIGKIGRFCEFSLSSQVFSAGEHNNDAAVNISFTGLPILNGAYNREAMKPSKPINIGGGVVISAGARVLSGVTIGDGAVIGGNAIVNRDVADWAVVAGVPARVIRLREPSTAWWDFETAYLLENMPRIQELARSPGPHRWIQEQPRIVIKKTTAGFSLDGISHGEKTLPFSEAPQSVRDYIVQAFAPGGTPCWLADCWPSLP